MRRVCGSVLVLGIVVFVACAAPAPEAPPLIGVAIGTLSWLSNVQIREELKLSEDQLKKIEELKVEQRQALAALRGLNTEDRAKKRQDIYKANEAALAKILSRKQLRRAEQIYLQTRGPMVWTSPQVAAALKLTDEQKEKIPLIVREMADCIGSARTGTSPSRE
jgi:Spy/CpxP family protein refolding chaperone